MIRVLIDAIKVIAQVFWNFGVMVFKMIYELSNIPTTQYGLVKFIAENNIVIMNNTILTKIIMFITPLIVSHILGYLTSLIGIKSFKIKEGLSIILYVMLLYLFSSWLFWLVIGVTISIIIIVSILKNVINKRTINLKEENHA